MAFTAVAIVDVLILTLTGKGNSGKDDSPGQRLGFVVFVLSVVAAILLGLAAGTHWWRQRTR